ncbi:uracil-DNA glycosylase [bacterium]|nr:uracil-DNA glycosylase [bacterium]
MQAQTQNKDPIQLESSWKKVLRSEFDQDYMKQLRQFLVDEIKNKKVIYPKPKEYFAAFEHTPVEHVRVVILGQDPYHGPGQAHGLCFSVQKGVVPPPSLKNIFKEIHQDLGLPIPQHGCLTKWAKQGVLLLNSVLTVQDGMAASHRNKGWERFTDRVIQEINNQQNPVVFLLWGSYAQSKAEFVDGKKHLVLKSVHPSPLSAHRGFLGCKHFSKANEFLKKNGLPIIDWSLD